MQGNGCFSQRIDKLKRKIEECEKIFNKNSLFLKKKVFSKKLGNSKEVDIICSSEETINHHFDQIKKNIEYYTDIYNKLL